MSLSMPNSCRIETFMSGKPDGAGPELVCAATVNDTSVTPELSEAPNRRFKSASPLVLRSR